jgi:hypothetical protein
MTIVLLHSHYDKAHLANVTEEMRELGAPTIKAIWNEMNGIWFALEGCHRLRAAEALELTPEIEEVEEWEFDMDQEVNELFPDTFEDPYTFADILDCGGNPTMITFEEE